MLEGSVKFAITAEAVNGEFIIENIDLFSCFHFHYDRE